MQTIPDLQICSYTDLYAEPLVQWEVRLTEPMVNRNDHQSASFHI